MAVEEAAISYSQYGQDRYIIEKLGGLRAGTFLEIGAFDGVSMSNTLLLERDYSWQGLCIEALPEAFASLRAQRKCVAVQAAATDVGGEVMHFQALSGGAAMLSGLADTQPRAQRRRIAGEVERSQSLPAMIEVKTVRAADVLRENGFERVDFASIDIEGGEFKCLQGLLDDDIEIGLMCVENNYSDMRVHRLLRQRGMLRIARMGSDDVYRRASECTPEDVAASKRFVRTHWRTLLDNASRGWRW